MSISVPGVPSSRKTPGITFNVVLGGPGSSSGSATKTLMLLGNMIGTAITGASPALSVAAGTATVATPVFVASDSDAQTLFGAGSELHRMALAVFAQYPDATLYACPVADAGGTAASGADYTLPAGTLTFAPGETTKLVPLALLDDGSVESAETLVVTLSGAAGATLTSTAVHTVTVTDDDLPVVTLAGLGCAGALLAGRRADIANDIEGRN